MFSRKDNKLNSEGLKDWKNASHLLKVHEDSQEHTAHMATWKEMRLAKGLTIDKQEMALTEAERKRWRDVLSRLGAIIQS